MKHSAFICAFLMISAGLAACGSSGEDIDAGNMTGNCMKTTDCNAGHVCIDGTCGLPGTILPGQPCSASRDCVSGDYCGAVGACTAGGSQLQDQTCTTDADCTAPGLRCQYSGFSGRCEQGGQGDVGQVCALQSDCLPGLFCGQSLECEGYPTAFPPWPGVPCPSDTRPFRSYFQVPRPSMPPADFLRLPYPNDIRVSGTSPKVLDISDFPDPGPTPADVDLVKLYTTALTADFDGFSSSAQVSFRFTSEIDFNSVRDNLQMWDLTTNAQVLSLTYDYTGQKTSYSCAPLLAVQPGVDAEPLTPNHTYVVFLTTGLLATDNTTAAIQDDDLTAVLATTRPATDASLQHAWDQYASFRTFLNSGATTVTAAQIANAAVFTVEDSTGHMQRLAAVDAPIPAPALTMLTVCNAGTVGPCGTDALHACGTDPNFTEIQGKFTVPIYQQGTEPYLTPKDGGNIMEVAGVPQKVRDEDVCFSLSIPNGTMPASGWPLMVYTHGTGGSMRDFITTGIAKQMATATTKSVVFSYDQVEHGARRGTSTADPNDLVFNVLNPRAARDNLLQGASDILTALKLPGSTIPAGFTGPTIKLDATKVTFFGHSQGADHGQLALGFTDAAPAAILSGSGANLLQALLNKTNPVNISIGMKFLLQDQLLAEYHPAMILFQTFFDRSDPLNYGPLFFRAPPAGLTAKNVYMSWGTGDTYTPAITLQWSADMLGLAPVTPVLENASALWVPPVNRPVTVPAVFQYMTPAGNDGHFVATVDPAAVTDWTAFIGSWLTTGTTTIP